MAECETCLHNTLWNIIQKFKTKNIRIIILQLSRNKSKKKQLNIYKWWGWSFVFRASLKAECCHLSPQWFMKMFGIVLFSNKSVGKKGLNTWLSISSLNTVGQYSKYMPIAPCPQPLAKLHFMMKSCLLDSHFFRFLYKLMWCKTAYGTINIVGPLLKS